MSTSLVNLHAWPGSGDVSRLHAERRTPAADRLAEHGGLVWVGAALSGVVPERAGLGVALAVVGSTILGAQLVVPDGLDKAAPAVAEALRQWAAAAILDTPAGRQPVEVVERQVFLDPDEGWLARRAYTGSGWLLTGDRGRSLGLLGASWTPGRGRFTGGWTIGVEGWGQVDTWTARGRERTGWRGLLHRPTLRVRSLGGHGIVAEWSRPGRGGMSPDGKRVGHWVRQGGKLLPFRGRIVDLIGPAFAFDGIDSGSLGSHLGAFGLAPCDISPQVPLTPDGAEAVWGAALGVHSLAVAVDAEAGLWLAPAEDQLDGRATVGLRGLVSPGTLATRVLRRTGVTPPLGKFSLSDKTLDRWSQAAHGGWTSCDLPGALLPVADYDVRSAYPSAWALAGWWGIYTAAQVVEVDVLEDLRELARRAAGGDLGVVTDPANYPTLGRTLCCVAPQGEPWPLETSDEDGTPRFSVGPVDGGTLWVIAADVLTAAYLSGRVPKVLSASRLDGVGAEPVRPLPLRGRLVVPAGADPVPALVRLRADAKARVAAGTGDAADGRLVRLLRVVANAAGWGAAARLDQHREHGRLVERPAAWTFPPVAAGVPAVSRLWLAAMERAVRDRGGAVATRDTDGLAILASPEGGRAGLPDGRQVEALSWAVLDGLVGGFDKLDAFGDGRPFWSCDRGSVDRPLHLLGLRRKRYVLAEPDGNGGFAVVGGTEHALGAGSVGPPTMVGRDPVTRRRRWTYAVAEHALDRVLGTDGDIFSAPWDRQGTLWPAIRRWVPGTPGALAAAPGVLEAGPFSSLLELPPSPWVALNDPDVSTLYALDPGGDLAGWDGVAWFDRAGRRRQPTTAPRVPGTFLADTLVAHADAWCRAAAPEVPGVVDLDMRLVQRVGRGGALVDAGLADPGADLSAFLVRYGAADAAGYVAELAGLLGPRRFARRYGVPLRTAEGIASGARRPSAATVRRVLGERLGGDGAPGACQLEGCGRPVPRAGARFCSRSCRERWSRVHTRPSAPDTAVCAMPGCAMPARPRSTTCSNRHRVALWRLRQAGEGGGG